MWHRFSPGLRRAILRAADETKGNGRLTTLDLLRAIATEAEEPVAKLLSRLDVSLERLAQQSEMAESSELACEAPTQGEGEEEPGLTPAARAAVERAYRIAADLEDWYIGGEHLLLALVREPQGGGDAGRVLAAAGATWQTAGRALVAEQRRRIRAPEDVHAPELRARRWKRRIRGQAGSVKRLLFCAVHYRHPYLPYMLFRRRTLRNPFGFYTRLRRDPVYWDSILNHWVVTGYDDVVAALAEPKLSQRVFSPSVWADDDHAPIVQREFRGLHGGLDHQMLFQDAPKHTRQRAAVAKRFTPAVIAQMREQMQALTDELLDALAPTGRMEVIGDIAIPYPMTIIARMMDLPIEERARFKQWSIDYFDYLTYESTLARELAAYRSVREAMEYFRVLIPARRRDPGGDLISMLAAPDDQGEFLPDDEIVSACLMLLATGHENTTRIIGSGLAALLSHPDQLQALRDDPSLIGSAVEEMLRYDSPVQWTMRHLREDLEWRGRRLKKGQRVQVGLGAANRDPARFPNPDRFDIARDQNRHVAFGYGAHFCLGAALGRLETQIVVGAIVGRFPALRLDRPAEWLQDAIAFRGIDALHVRWD